MFSPRKDDSALDWYAELIRHATAGTFIAAPFGLSGSIKTVFEEHADQLRYVLVDKETTKTVALEVRDGHPENQITGQRFCPRTTRPVAQGGQFRSNSASLTSWSISTRRFC